MLRFLYFTIASMALTWGLCGWASHFLMPAPVLYKTSLIVGFIGGLALTLYPWGRNLTRVLLLMFWPTLVATVYFASIGTFDFSEVSFAELLNFEFSLMWAGAVWAFFVLKRRKPKVFDESAATPKRWQKSAPLIANLPTYRIPARESDDLQPDYTGETDATAAFVSIDKALDRDADDTGGNWTPLDELEAAGIVESHGAGGSPSSSKALNEPEMDTTGFTALDDELSRWKNGLDRNAEKE